MGKQNADELNNPIAAEIGTPIPVPMANFDPNEAALVTQATTKNDSPGKKP